MKNATTHHNIFKASLALTAGLGVAGLVGFTYANLLEPTNLTVSRIKVPIPKLSDRFEGYRIAQISDLHAGTWLNQERLQRVVDMINAEQPDLVAITGDFVTHGEVMPLQHMIIDPLANVNAPDGIVAVTGNHDYRTNVGHVREILKSGNIRELKNNSIVLERDQAKLAIAGVDDVWAHKADLDRVIKTLPEADVPAILLAHEPDYADASARSGRFALQMSGHSHGGQIRLPFMGPPYLPRYGRKYPIGQYQVRNMIQYTNRGIGMTPPNFRFGCPPEITIFDLTHVA